MLYQSSYSVAYTRYSLTVLFLISCYLGSKWHNTLLSLESAKRGRPVALRGTGRCQRSAIVFCWRCKDGPSLRASVASYYRRGGGYRRGAVCPTQVLSTSVPRSRRMKRAPCCSLLCLRDFQPWHSFIYNRPALFSSLTALKTVDIIDFIHLMHSCDSLASQNLSVNGPLDDFSVFKQWQRKLVKFQFLETWSKLIPNLSNAFLTWFFAGMSLESRFSWTIA